MKCKLCGKDHGTIFEWAKCADREIENANKEIKNLKEQINYLEKQIEALEETGT